MDGGIIPPSNTVSELGRFDDLGSPTSAFIRWSSRRTCCFVIVRTEFGRMTSPDRRPSVTRCRNRSAAETIADEGDE